MQNLVFMFMLISLTSCFSQKQNPVEAVSTTTSKGCIENRVAFDVGSGSTKVKVATVDFCQHKILKELLDLKKSVNYSANLAKSADNKLDSTVIEDGHKAITEMYKAAENVIEEEFKKNKTPFQKPFKGVATAAFRKAVNGQEFLQKLEANLGLKLEIITQELEGALGYMGVQSIIEKNPKNILVWDIGGGSMQFTIFNGSTYSVYGNSNASQWAKSMVLANQGKDLKAKTPNPISLDESKQSLVSMEKEFRNKLPKPIQDVVDDFDTQVVGIGGVHAISLMKKSLKKSTYDTSDIDRAVQTFIGKTDEQINDGDYSDVVVTNLLLVEAAMKSMGMTDVHAMDINLTQGILLYDRELKEIPATLLP